MSLVQAKTGLIGQANQLKLTIKKNYEYRYKRCDIVYDTNEFSRMFQCVLCFFVVFHDSITHLVTNTVQSRKYEVTETLCLLGCHFQFSVESYQ